MAVWSAVKPSSCNQLALQVTRQLTCLDCKQAAPEVKDLMDARQREITADVVNHALLAAQSAPPWPSPRRQAQQRLPTSKLVRLLYRAMM